MEMGSQAVRLDRESILDAVERIAASEGVGKLTMRRIGSELGADPTAIYRHFRNKQELLSCLAERMFLTEPEIDPEQPWQQQLRVHLRHAFNRYRAHPDLGILLARQPDDLPGLVRLADQALGLLIDGAGLDLEQAARISHQLENHVVGCGLFFAISEYHRDPRIADPDAMRRAYALLSTEEYPYASAAAPYLFGDPDEMFDRTTDLFIEAIERQAQPAHAAEEDR